MGITLCFIPLLFSLLRVPKGEVVIVVVGIVIMVIITTFALLCHIHIIGMDTFLITDRCSSCGWCFVGFVFLLWSETIVIVVIVILISIISNVLTERIGGKVGIC